MAFSELKGDLKSYETVRHAGVERKKLQDKIAAIEGELSLKSSAEDSEKVNSYLETLIAEKTSKKLGILEF